MSSAAVAKVCVCARARAFVCACMYLCVFVGVCLLTCVYMCNCVCVVMCVCMCVQGCRLVIASASLQPEIMNPLFLLPLLSVIPSTSGTENFHYRGNFNTFKHTQIQIRVHTHAYSNTRLL